MGYGCKPTDTTDRRPDRAPFLTNWATKYCIVLIFRSEGGSLREGWSMDRMYWVGGTPIGVVTDVAMSVLIIIKKHKR